MGGEHKTFEALGDERKGGRRDEKCSVETERVEKL